MKYNPTFNQDSEFRLIQRLDRLEANLYKVKRSLLKWTIGLALTLVASEGVLYHLFHSLGG
ncbi:hypothetical protein [Rickettsiella massiliensis]|uniref:hypothetical protein n=1 Tax=Rickettsiella massiliensis TaxID=676517 RepID=UPI00029A8D37|nr:hypothetical protein [Rickettsiella massiliensis]